jgi:alpha-tectorin
MKKGIIILVAVILSVNAVVDIQNFFPFGTAVGDQYLANGDDTSSRQQFLSTDFNFFNYSHSSLWVNVNGAISFLAPISTYTPFCTALPRNYRMISPFWADVDTQSEVPSPTSGISFRESNATNVLQQAKREVLQAFPNLGDINLTWSYIVTWNNVTFYRDDASRGIRNTFQAVITSNGVHSFAIFYYNKIQWTTGQASNGTVNGLGGTPAQIGFDAGDGENRKMLDVSCTSNVINIGSMSNVGKPGVFVFQIDAAEIETPAPVTMRPTEGPSDPRSDEIGTECSSNVTQAWLDVMFVIDTSSAMSSRDLLELSGEIATFMKSFNFGQSNDPNSHTTRAGIVTYATGVESRYNLTDVTDEKAWRSEILKLRNFANPNDNGANVQGGLQMAFSLLEAQKSFRKGVIILIAAAYTDAGFQGAAQTSKTIQEDGISIITVSFASADGVLTNQLKNISSPGYSYVSNQEGLYITLPFALTQLNCFCPPSALQFKNYNTQWQNYTIYADCFYGFSGDTLPSISNDLCSPGVLASVTSKAKLDFISDYVVPHDLPGKKKFTVGLHLADDNQWKWWGYQGDEYSLGNYPTWGQSPAPGDAFSYESTYGFNIKLMPGGDDAKPYVCQSRACDANYICDLSNSKLN